MGTNHKINITYYPGRLAYTNTVADEDQKPIGPTAADVRA